MKILAMFAAISIYLCGVASADESVQRPAPSAAVGPAELSDPASGSGLLPMPPAPPPIVIPVPEKLPVQVEPEPTSRKSPTSAGTPASAVTKPTINTALKAFNDRNFGGALAQFDKLDRNGMCNEKVHYYMGRCCQQLSQVTRALDNYGWVISYGKDPTLKYYAEVAAGQISRYSKHRTYAGNGNRFVASGGGSSGGG